MITHLPTRLASGLCASLLLLSNAAYAADGLSPDPEIPLTRAEFVRILVDGMYDADTINTCFPRLWPRQYELLFSDVSIQESYAPELCVAMRAGIIEGYQDGSFQPDRQINFAEAAKVLTRALVLSPYAGQPDGQPWFYTHVKSLEYRGAIPPSITSFEHKITSRDLDEILRRLESDATELPSTSYDALIDKTHAMYAKMTQRG